MPVVGLAALGVPVVPAVGVALGVARQPVAVRLLREALPAVRRGIRGQYLAR
jgi:hypothetical protein